MSQQQSKKKGQLFEEFCRKCINSGSLWFDKLDLEVGDFKIDTKITDKKSYRITSDVVDKVWNQALDEHKLPGMIIGIPDPEFKEKLFVLEVKIRKVNHNDFMKGK